jgi:hypothetical protein
MPPVHKRLHIHLDTTDGGDSIKVYKVLLGLLGLMGLLVACQQGGPQLGSPDFAVVLSRASVGFGGEGDTAEVLVQVVAKNGFNGPVTLSVEGLPSCKPASTRGA